MMYCLLVHDSRFELVSGWGGGPEVGEAGGWAEPTAGPAPQPEAAFSRFLLLQTGLLAPTVGFPVEDELVGGIGQPVDGALRSQGV